MLSFELIQQITSLLPISTLSVDLRAQVVVALDRFTNIEYVLKIGPLQALKVEVECLESMPKHPNLIQLHNCFQSQDLLILQFEKAPGFSLTSHLLSTGKLSFSQTCEIFKQLVSAIEHLHKHGWIHRDLKPDNVVFDSSTNSIKLVDFEFASRWSKKTLLSESLGTLEYSSPEVRKGNLYRGPEIDMWSLGVTMFVMLFVEFPFSRQELAHFHESTVVMFKKNPVLFHSIPKSWSSVLCKLLEVQASKRMRLSQLKHFLRKQTASKSKTPIQQEKKEPLKQSENLGRKILSWVTDYKSYRSSRIK